MIIMILYCTSKALSPTVYVHNLYSYCKSQWLSLTVDRRTLSRTENTDRTASATGNKARSDIVITWPNTASWDVCDHAPKNVMRTLHGCDTMDGNDKSRVTRQIRG